MADGPHSPRVDSSPQKSAGYGVRQNGWNGDRGAQIRETSSVPSEPNILIPSLCIPSRLRCIGNMIVAALSLQYALQERHLLLEQFVLSAEHCALRTEARHLCMRPHSNCRRAYFRHNNTNSAMKMRSGLGSYRLVWRRLACWRSCAFSDMRVESVAVFLERYLRQQRSGQESRELKQCLRGTSCTILLHNSALHNSAAARSHLI